MKTSNSKKRKRNLTIEHKKTFYRSINWPMGKQRLLFVWFLSKNSILFRHPSTHAQKAPQNCYIRRNCKENLLVFFSTRANLTKLIAQSHEIDSFWQISFRFILFLLFRFWISFDLWWNRLSLPLSLCSLISRNSINVLIGCNWRRNSWKTYLFRRLAYSKYSKNNRTTKTTKLVIKLFASFILRAKKIRAEITKWNVCFNYFSFKRI